MPLTGTVQLLEMLKPGPGFPPELKNVLICTLDIRSAPFWDVAELNPLFSKSCSYRIRVVTAGAINDEQDPLTVE